MIKLSNMLIKSDTHIKKKYHSISFPQFRILFKAEQSFSTDFVTAA